MLLRDRRPKRTTCLVLAAASVLAACAGPGDPRTGVDRLQADLVFGLKPPSEGAPPAFNPPPLLQEGEEILDLPSVLPTPALTPPRPRRQFPTPTTPVEACPEAALTAFPAVPADVNVTAKPKEGLTRWKRSGTRTIEGTATELRGFERRVLRRVHDTTVAFSPTATQEKLAYTYETIRSLDLGSFEVTQFKVNSAPVTSNTASDVTGGALSPDPEPGLVIKRVDIVNADGTTTPSFAPPTGLLLLPLPVTAGASFTSTASDPVQQKVVVLEGRVLGRGRVDACGDVVDGWRVEATITQRVVGRPDETVKSRYLVATQYGAVVVAQQDEGTTADETFAVSFELGQLEPDPLPESLR